MQLRNLLAILALLFGTLHTEAQDNSLYWSLSGNSIATATGTSKLGTTSALPLNLVTNNLTRMRIDPNGRIGVGFTTTPATLFQVNGYGSFGNKVTGLNATRALNLADDNAVMRILRTHASFAPAVELISRTSADGPNVAYWDFYAEPSDKSFRIRDRVTGANLDRVTISGAGNVGIGTTTPHSKLSVRRSDGLSNLARLTNSSTTGDRSTLVEMQSGNGVLWRFGVSGTGNSSGLSNGQFYIAQGDKGPFLTITQEGHVGIGTVTPTKTIQEVMNGPSGTEVRVNLDLRGEIYMYGTRFLSNGTPGVTQVDNELGQTVETIEPGSDVFVGPFSGANMGSGGLNTAVGYGALQNSTSGSLNTALGYNALHSANHTSGNTAIGLSSLYGTSTGSDNTAIGHSSLSNNTTGSNNTAVGAGAHGFNRIGAYNTTIGDYTLRSNETGYYNTALGYRADVTVDGLNNATVVGAGAFVDASNKVRIGNTSVTSIGGQVGWTVFSDGRYKRNIREDVHGLDFINSLKPITYTVDVQELNAHYSKGSNQPEDEQRRAADEKYKAAIRESEQKAGKVVYNGFVAQEVEEAAKKLKYEFSGVDKPQTEGGLYGLRYSDFVVPLVKAVQELSKKDEEVDILKAEVVELKKENAEIKRQFAELKALLTGNSNNSSSIRVSAAYLEQNSPNPSRGSTIIRYGVPDDASSARLTLTNSKGQVLKTININGRGTGQVNLETSALSAGVYNYSLWIAGREVDTKQLVITR